MADLIPWSNLLPAYQSPQAMAVANANVANTNAQTGLLGAQTQGADLQNQRTQGQIAWAQQPPLPGGASGASTGAPAPGTTASPGAGTWNGAAPTGDGTSLADYGLDNAHILAHVQQKFAPPVPYTPQEQSALIWAQQGIRLGAPGAAEQLQAIETQRQARIQNATQANQQGALSAYNVGKAVYEAPHGAAVQFLSRFYPDKAEELEKVAKANGQDPDTLVRTYATEVASATYGKTGRETYLNPADGKLYDKQTGQPVLGAAPPGMTAAQAGEQANVRRGQDIGQWEVQSDQNGNQWSVNKVTGQRMPVGAAPSAPPAAASPPSGGLLGNAPATPTAPNAAPATPAAGGNPAPATQGPPEDPGLIARLRGNGSPSAGTAAPGSAPSPGTAPAKDNGLLPGVDVKQLPMTQASTGFVNKTGQQLATDTQTERISQLKDASAQSAQNQQERALIDRAQTEVAKIDPRYVGPGSELAQGLAKITKTVSGGAPDDLVNLGELDKTLLNMGAQNVRTALSGQRITNQEFTQLLSHGNPNTEQPKETMQRILNYLSANNDYDSRLQRTRTAALTSGADPWQLNGSLGQLADRSSYIQKRTGVSPSAVRTGGGNASAAPAVGMVRGGYRFNGGDPSNKANWSAQ